MWRWAQPLRVRCLLSGVKVLRFNYEKMLAVGSVPLEDRQGQGCGCPPWHRGRRTSARPREPVSPRSGTAAPLRTCTPVGRARERGATVFSSNGGGECGLLPSHPPSSLVLALASLWWSSGGRIRGAGLAGESWSFLGEDVCPSHLPEPCHWGAGHVGAV